MFENKDLDIDLSPDLQGEYTLTVYTLDENASALHNWVKLGAPQYPTKAQVQLLKAQSPPHRRRGVSRHSVFTRRCVRTRYARCS